MQDKKKVVYASALGYNGPALYVECYAAVRLLAKRDNISISQWLVNVLEKRGHRSSAGTIYRALGDELVRLLEQDQAISSSSQE